MEGYNGKKLWVFPDLEMPKEGQGELKGHESIIILNMNQKPANISMSFYFDDKDPVKDVNAIIDAERVRCFRTNNSNDFNGIELQHGKQYALRIESDIEVVVQYGRLDVTQPNMAFYTVMGYCK